MAVVSFLKSVMCSPESNFLALPMETRALSRTTTISGRDRPGGVRGIQCVSLDCTLHNKSERSSCGSDFTPETTRETDPGPGWIIWGRVRKWAWKWETSCLCQSLIKLRSWRVVYCSTLRWWSGAPLCFLTCSRSDTKQEQITLCVYLPLCCCSLLPFCAINLNPVQSFILLLLYFLFVILALFLFLSAVFGSLLTSLFPKGSVTFRQRNKIVPHSERKAAARTNVMGKYRGADETLSEPVSPPQKKTGKIKKSPSYMRLGNVWYVYGETLL